MSSDIARLGEVIGSPDNLPSKHKNICVTFVQCWTNADVVQNTNVLCLLAQCIRCS